MNLIKDLKQIVKGGVEADEKTLEAYSHDASLFEVKPKIVIFPKDENDIKAVVSYVNKHKILDASLSITARSGGTDMSGGSINNSIILDFTRYFNHTPTIKDRIAQTEPGVYYRDFENETLRHNLIFPSYPASREICAMGGIINNNSGGEKSLAYGKTEDYVEELDVVLSDGNKYTIKPLTELELNKKIKQNNFEGKIYKKIFSLINENYEAIKTAKPQVTKNSSGYFLWNVYDKNKKIFDLTKLFVGAQGTLGMVTKAKIKLVPTKRYAEMMIIFMHDEAHLGEIIKSVLSLAPETFEAYDDNTLKLALKFFPSFAKMLGAKNILRSIWEFIPEFFIILTNGMPKLILQVDFTSDNREELDKKIEKLKELLLPLRPKTRIAHNRHEEEKYWLIRRESFNLLRRKIKDKHTAPFIDDFVVNPEFLPEFLPKLNNILKKYPSLIYTLAGHVGNGNFHIIPLMDIKRKEERNIIPVLSQEVYDLVLKYKGSITGEHNDGLIRTPFVKKMYGEKINKLFEEVKIIFDPKNIFNPRKKVFGDLNFAMNHIRQTW